jgi:hypothetical protein
MSDTDLGIRKEELQLWEFVKNSYRLQFVRSVFFFAKYDRSSGRGEKKSPCEHLEFQMNQIVQDNGS